MAIQKSVSQFRGRVGNLVGYRVTNAAKEGTNGLRVHVDTIANPRTLAQATQRMRMAPAVNFYRGLADLLDHSWQGVKYGARSRAYFMKMALTPGAYNIPYVNRNEKSFIPGEYPLASGSVPLALGDTSFITFGETDVPAVNFSLFNFTDVFSVTQTFGDFSKSSLSGNSLLRDGDEITLVCVFEVQPGVYVPLHKYIVLDTTSLALTRDVFTAAGFFVSDCNFMMIGGIRDDGYVFPLIDAPIVAAGIIVSRHPSRTSNSWLRSASTLICSPEFKAKWMSDARFAEARASYQKEAAELTSDWLLNQGSNEGGTGLNPATTYALSQHTTSIGGLNVDMVNLSIDSATPKPILAVVGTNYYYGKFADGSMDIVNFTTAQKLTQAPQDGTYYDVADVREVMPAQTFDTSDIDDTPQVENPGA